jgi:putative redox protein
MVTTASARWTDEERFVGIASSGHAIVADSGDHKTANGPMELVLIGLCSCTATDEPFTSLEVRAEAERASTVPMVYTEIKLVYRVGGKVSKKAVEDAVNLSEEKYCSVSGMLQKTAKITYAIEYVD